MKNSNTTDEQQNEKLEGSHQKTSSASEQKESEQATEKSSSSADDQSKIYRNRRMTFLALLEAAMRYREVTWREEIEEYALQYEAGRVRFIDASTKANQRGKNHDWLPDGPTLRRWNRIFDSNKSRELDQYSKKVKSFNDRMYREMADTYKQLTEESNKFMDNFSTGAAMIIEEYMKASNTADIVSVCKLYNEGTFDQLINEGREKLKKQKEDEKNNSNDDHHSGSDDNYELQEKLTATPDTKSITELGGNDELDGHQQGRELQDGSVIINGGVEYRNNTGPTV